MLPAHEYGCIPYTNYYTDTMGILMRNHMNRSIFMWEWQKKRLTLQYGCLDDFENKPVYLVRCHHVDMVHLSSLCCLVLFSQVSLPMKMMLQWVGGIPNGFNAETGPTHTHTHHPHLSNQPGNTLVSWHCALWVAKQPWLSLGSIVKSHLYCCGVCSWGDGAELLQPRSRARRLKVCDVSDFCFSNIINHGNHPEHKEFFFHPLTMC